MVSPLDASIQPQHSPTTQPVEQVDLSSASKQDFTFHNILYRDQLFELDIRSPVSDTCAFRNMFPGMVQNKRGIAMIKMLRDGILFADHTERDLILNPMLTCSDSSTLQHHQNGTGNDDTL